MVRTILTRIEESMHYTPRLGLGALLAALLAIGPATAAEVNIYSARHYQSDDQLYDAFTKQTGIRVNRIEDDADKLVTRIENEGANSPADVLITVDAGRLWRAEGRKIFQPITSKLLDERIPASVRSAENDWFGFSKRARVILYNKEMVKEPPKTYAALADPKYKGLVCIRSGSSIYNLSLLAAIIAHKGEAEAEAWARGVVANFARSPKGGDSDQIKAVAVGECGIAVANTYYFVRFVKSDKAADQDVARKVAVVFPDQEGDGTHVNISGAGVIKYAPHKAEAVKFLEYLASDEAQHHFASGNNEYPVVADVATDPALAALGDFKADPINVAVLGKNQELAQKIYDRAGWK